MAPKIAIVYYSTWGHIQKLAEAEAAGIEKAGGKADIFQLPETLSDEVLGKMHAPPKPTHIKVLNDPHELEQYDGFLFGVPTRYGNQPAQWRTFWDRCGGIWASGGYWGKFAGIFVCSGGPGGGQESTVMSSMSTLAHQGIIYVPLGYKFNFQTLDDTTEVRGGSPWGAGTFSKGDGSRQPTETELQIARNQGEAFYKIMSNVNGAGIKSITL